MDLTDLLPELEADFPLPPTDPTVLQDWLLEQEEKLAAQIGSSMEDLARRFLNEFIDSLTAAGDYSIINKYVDGWTALANSDLGIQVLGMYTSGSVGAWMSAPGQGDTNLQPQAWAQVVNDNAVAYRREVLPRMVGAGKDTLQEVQQLTVNKLRTGQDPRQLVADIQDVTGVARSRAQTIARTEVIGAYNNGNMAGARELGEFGPVKKEWSSFIDNRTRDSHIEADGQTVWFEDTFEVGGEQMDAPHDPGADPAEVVNCRCQVILLYEGDIDRDGNVVTRLAGDNFESLNEWEPPPTDFDVSMVTRNPDSGGHPSFIMSDSQGNNYLFKPSDNLSAAAEVSANRIQQLSGLETPRMWVHTDAQGRTGTLQQLIQDKPGGLPRRAFDSREPDFSMLTSKQIQEIQKHRILDWTLGNHDGHAAQFVAGRNGIVGIDKGQAWKFYGKDRLDFRYVPNQVYGEAAPLANLFEQRVIDGTFRGRVAWVGGKNPVDDFARQLQGINNAEYARALKPYADARFGFNTPASNQFIADMLVRKNNLVSDFTAYHKSLQAQRPIVARKTPARQTGVAGEGGPKGMQGAQPADAAPRFGDVNVGVRSAEDFDHPFAVGETGPVVDAFARYTGSAYLDMNSALRAGNLPASIIDRTSAEAMFKSMPALKKDVVLYRGTKLQKTLSGMNPAALEGSIIRDRAFLSTNTGKLGPAFEGDTALLIRANANTAQGRYVDAISKVQGEREFVLQADSLMYVHKVRPMTPLERQTWTEKGFNQVMEVEIVDRKWAEQFLGTGGKAYDTNKRSFINEIASAFG